MHTEKFVILKGIECGNIFFSSNTPGADNTKSASGETWYNVLGYADTVDEAQRKIARHRINHLVGKEICPVI